mgnify:CR=1 FL=1
MPVCEKCKKHFPNRVEIDGKARNLCKRKYCLECSPFGEFRIPKKIHLDGREGHCQVCGKEFDYNRVKGNRRTRCSGCILKRFRNKRKQKAIDYKGGKCSICGYNKCNRSLQFHHLDETTKELELSSSWSASWERTKKELDKCILVCANCHGEMHEGNL